ncbi:MULTISPECIES: hypothetical protein [Heyndrickxia]|uniref:hypothetical protein n=1 Tax=Heyndrickxia TaxID=2837504 RepID=UPI0013A5A3A4|nr:hypothetical protein [Heyndrickxia coagulans]
MNRKEIQNDFKHVLEYGYKKAIEDPDISINQLLQEITDRLRDIYANIRSK